MSEERETQIDEIIESLRKFWKEVPEFRLGQLIINVERGLAYRTRQKADNQASLFYKTDDEMLQEIEFAFNEVQEMKDEENTTD